MLNFKQSKLHEEYATIITVSQNRMDDFHFARASSSVGTPASDGRRPNISMCRACRFLLIQVVNCSVKRHGVPPVLRNIEEAIASDLRMTKMYVSMKRDPQRFNIRMGA